MHTLFQDMGQVQIIHNFIRLPYLKPLIFWTKCDWFRINPWNKISAILEIPNGILENPWKCFGGEEWRNTPYNVVRLETFFRQDLHDTGVFSFLWGMHPISHGLDWSSCVATRLASHCQSLEVGSARNPPDPHYYSFLLRWRGPMVLWANLPSFLYLV